MHRSIHVHHVGPVPVQVDQTIFGRGQRVGRLLGLEVGRPGGVQVDDPHYTGLAFTEVERTVLLVAGDLVSTGSLPPL
jgi:hypothetical protein